VLNYKYPHLDGGASTASFYSARELVRRGHQIKVLSRKAVDQSEFETLEGVPVYRAASIRKSAHEVGLRSTINYIIAARKKPKQLLHESSCYVNQYEKQVFLNATREITKYPNRITQ
jgi:hypothetical protein